MVLQETWLKTGTIRENIAMGRPDATEEEIVEAAKASHIHNYIRRLPKGYDTWITEDGGGLSQGQKQLLCIARVMLCRPPMLILDEATSSIDTRTEIKIQQAFAKLMEGRTTFIVAHLSLIHISQKYVGRISGMMNPLTYIIVNGAIIALIYVGAVRVDIGDLTQGQVVALINYMSQILVELVKLANLIISVTKAAACLNLSLIHIYSCR